MSQKPSTDKKTTAAAAKAMPLPAGAAKGNNQAQIAAAAQQLPGQEIVMQAAAQQQREGRRGDRNKEARVQKPSVYVGNLPKDYYQLDLFKHVKALGFKILAATILPDKQTRKQNRFGFLAFNDEAEARRCAQALNNTELNGSILRCSYQEKKDSFDPKSNVIVRGIESSVTQEQLYEAFAQFGAIHSCKLEVYQDGKSREFGYVQFEKLEAAEAAIEQNNKLEIQGKKVEITTHLTKDKRKGEEKRFLNIYVQQLPEGTDDDALKAMFAPHGEITSAQIQRKDDKILNKGYVSFKTNEQATKAIQAMNKKQMDDGTILLVTQHISKRDNQVSTSSNPIQSSMRKTFESNLFVKNIPSDVDEEEIRRRFEECGPIISIKLRQGKYFNKEAAYRQYFILYKDIECAKKAIQIFDQSSIFGGRPLSVQFWMPISDLHQEREQRSFQALQAYFSKGMNFQPQAGYAQDLRQGGASNRPQYQNRNNQRGGPNNRNNQNAQNRRQNMPRQQRTATQQAATEQPVPVINTANMPPMPTAALTPEQQQQIAVQQQQQAQLLLQQQQQAAQVQQQMQAQAAAQQQQQTQLIDVKSLQALDANQRRQEIGNAIYPLIQQGFGDVASKITGMLLDNEKVVDPIQLVTNMTYLQTKATEAFQLLQQSNAVATQPAQTAAQPAPQQ